jgi:hypothetical protein
MFSGGGGGEIPDQRGIGKGLILAFFRIDPQPLALSK